MDIRIVFIFDIVVFLGVSHITYCSETRDTKNVVGAKVRFGVYRRELILALAVFPSEK
jgi:hypothetical protein